MLCVSRRTLQLLLKGPCEAHHTTPWHCLSQNFHFLSLMSTASKSPPASLGLSKPPRSCGPVTRCMSELGKPSGCVGWVGADLDSLAICRGDLATTVVLEC